jgi:uncharacterized protein (DUF779 family)
MVERVLATREALQLIQRLKQKHGPLMFHEPHTLAQQGSRDTT